MRRSLFVSMAGLLVFTTTALASFPSFVSKVGFRTPSGNIVCNAGPLIGRDGTISTAHALACVLFSQSGNRGQKTWYLRDSERSGVTFVEGNIATEGIGVARYGHTWRWQGFRCSSRTTGLTCRNSAGHGFFLSRARQRRF
jgi:hypothetical protein